MQLKLRTKRVRGRNQSGRTSETSSEPFIGSRQAKVFSMDDPQQQSKNAPHYHENIRSVRLPSALDNNRFNITHSLLLGCVEARKRQTLKILHFHTCEAYQKGGQKHLSLRLCPQKPVSLILINNKKKKVKNTIFFNRLCSLFKIFNFC